MKKSFVSIMAIVLVMVLSLGLAACGSTGKVEPKVEPTEEPTEELQLGFGLEENFEETEELDENPDRAIIRAGEPILQNVITKLDGTCVRSELYLYRSNLSEICKQAYDLIRAGILEGKTEIKMTVPITKDELKTIFRAVFYDCPDLFWMDGGYGYAYNNYGNVTKVKPKYNALSKDIAGNTQKLENAVSAALADMWSLSDATAQVKYAHDYLTANVSYDLNSAYNQTAYSALVNGSSVCAGYSRAFQYMMQKMDIRCGYISGTSKTSAGSGNHAWNIVELDGEFYAMDVTWDDPIGAQAGKYYYTYFNVTNAAMGSDHWRGDVSAALPAASGTAKSFAAAFGGNQYGTDFDGIQGALPEGYGTASNAFIGGKTAEETSTSGNPYLP